MQTISSKTKDLIKDEVTGKVIGITGRVRNKKNKISMPFAECEFKLLFDSGLDENYGIVDLLIMDGHVTEASKGWYNVPGVEKIMRKKQIEESFSSIPSIAELVE